MPARFKRGATSVTRAKGSYNLGGKDEELD